MHVTQLIQHADGTTTIRPDTPQTRERWNGTTYRQPRGTTTTRRTRNGHPETQATPPSQRGPEEALATWRGQNGDPKWGNGLKAKRGSDIGRRPRKDDNTPPTRYGTGGNAATAIPTGPTNGGRPTTGNPVVTVPHSKWHTLREQATIAHQRGTLPKPQLTAITRAMTAALGEHGRNPNTLRIRIDGLTEKEWRAIRKVRVGRTRQTKKAR